MNNKIRFIAVIILAITLVAVFSFTGCKAAPVETAAVSDSEITTAETAAETTVSETIAAETTSGEPVTLEVWYWGEQEAVGVKPFMEESAELFMEKYPNITVNLTLESLDDVFGTFPQAAAAGKPPDIAFSWDGVWLMDWVWLGYVAPLDEIIPMDELIHMGITPLSYWDGHFYRMGLYGLTQGWMYNPVMFQDAGVPENLTPPTTWEDLLTVCQTLKDAGQVPLTVGLKDQLFGEFFKSLIGVQAMDNYMDEIKLAVGEEGYRYDDPKYWDHYAKVQELIDKGYINTDASSIDYYQSIELFQREGAAISPNGLSPQLYTSRSVMGAEKAKMFETPLVPDAGKMGDYRGIGVVQGLLISEGSKHKAEAALFLKFLHEKERDQAIYKFSGAYATTDIYNPELRDNSIYTDEDIKSMLEWFSFNHLYLGLIIPWDISNDANYVGYSELFAESATPEQLGKKSQEVAERWRGANPDLAEKTAQWGAGVIEAVEKYFK